MNILSIITCKVNNKSYICVTKNGELNPGKNFNPLIYGHGTIFIRAVKKYGLHNFTIKVIGYGFKTRKEMHLAERKAILEYNTLFPNGYNIRQGGNGPSFGTIHGKLIKLAQSKPEIKRKMQIANKEISNRPDVKLKKSIATKLLYKNPEFRLKRSIMVKEFMNRPEVKEKHRESVRNAVKKWWKNTENRKNRITALRKRSASTKYRKKLSIALLKSWKDRKTKNDIT